tara:strand:- start:682 stop:789 length:108 start_codon:yes stop_codon:yes gene_type:complete
MTAINQILISIPPDAQALVEFGFFIAIGITLGPIL